MVVISSVSRKAHKAHAWKACVPLGTVGSNPTPYEWTRDPALAFLQNFRFAESRTVYYAFVGDWIEARP